MSNNQYTFVNLHCISTTTADNTRLCEPRQMQLVGDRSRVRRADSYGGKAADGTGQSWLSDVRVAHHHTLSDNEMALSLSEAAYLTVTQACDVDNLVPIDVVCR